MGAAHQEKGLANVFTLYNTATPRIWADIDRAKADMLGVPPRRVFEALQVYLGSAYVNDFNLLGRTFRVTAQAEAAARDDPADIAQLKTRSNSGAMVPIGASRPSGQDRPVPRDPLQPLPRGRGRWRDRAGTRPARRSTRWRSWPSAACRLRDEWTGIAFQQKRRATSPS